MKLPIERVSCKCGDVEGFLVLSKALIEIKDCKGNVKRVAPTEFEAMGGRGSAKKWKESVKIGSEIPQFQGKSIGAYMREQLGVDIMRGSLQPYYPDSKPATSSKSAPSGSKSAPLSPKPTKSSPIHVPDSPPPRKRKAPSPTPSAVSLELSPSPQPDEDMQEQDKELSLQMPLIERINIHSQKHFCCYETPFDTFEEEEDELDPAGAIASILMKSPAQRVDVPIEDGMPRSSKGILFLESVSMPSLIDLGLMSATSEADLDKTLLSEIPPVPAERLSKIPQYESTSKKRKAK